MFEFRAQPLPEGQSVFRPVLPHTHTAPQPFAVYEKDPMVTRQKLVEQTLKMEAALREFKANGIPSLSPELPVVEVCCRAMTDALFITFVHKSTVSTVSVCIQRHHTVLLAIRSRP